MHPLYLLASLLVHAVVIGVLVMRVQAPAPRIITPAVIQGVLLENPREVLRETKERERRAAEAKAAEIREQARREKAAAEERQREAENRKRIADELDRQKKRDQELKAAAERKAEEARKKADEARKKAEQERQKKIDDARKKAEAEQKRLEAEDLRIRKQLKKDMEAAMAAEEAERAANERARQNATATNVWVGLIKDAVQRNWVRPAGLGKNFSCVVAVEQLPGGQIISVKIVESCGSPLLDNSVESAVRKSDPLPIAPNPAIYERSIRFTFQPE